MRSADKAADIRVIPTRESLVLFRENIQCYYRLRRAHDRSLSAVLLTAGIINNRRWKFAVFLAGQSTTRDILLYA